VLGSTMGTRTELVDLVEFLLTTGVRPLIDREWPLTDASEAFRALEHGDVRGKLVLTR
jgi:D-arabinose 1-dehydrogenase-like Zn-dependent alcohol dehydrogenase